MDATRYLIVGGGMTGDAAAKGIREHDPDGSIRLVGAEPHAPYARPAALEGALARRRRGEDLAPHRRGRESTCASAAGSSRSTSRHGGRPTTQRRDARVGQAPARDGRSPAHAPRLRGRRLLPDARRLPPPPRGGRRGRAGRGHRRRLHRLGARGRAHGAGCSVTMVFPDPGIASRLLPAALSGFVTEYYREQGVEVLTEETVVSAGADRSRRAPAARSRPTWSSPGSGSSRTRSSRRPPESPSTTGSSSTSSAASTGIRDVFAAGDVANFPVPALGRRLRVEHEDHANTHGRVVGANMAGAGMPYDHLPFFYSDMFDLGYEAVGELDPRLDTMERWDVPNRKGDRRLRRRRAAGRAGSCSGTCGTRSRADAQLIRAAEPTRPGAHV